MEGDKFLSGMDKNLWSLTYHIIRKFGCEVIFRKHGPNVPGQRDLYIEFFVPGDHPKCDRVVRFIKDELKHEEKEGKFDEDLKTYLFGCHVSVYKFKGVEPDLEVKYVRELASCALDILTKKLTIH